MRRDTENGMVFGVCAGLAEAVSVDPALIRIAFLGLTLFGFGTPVIIYLVLAVCVPEN